MKIFSPISSDIGLFVIPIKVNPSTNTYEHYVDFVVKAANSGYTHLYIGEHLTDSREDIQSSIVFASAILARTTKLIVCLSVLPLPHYNIKLLVKQLEDLYRLSSGRLRLGFSQGALASDLTYLGIDPTERSELFISKLAEFEQCVSASQFLSSLYPSGLFSTLLSKYPMKSSSLRIKGYSGLSSNFTNPKYLVNHVKCFFAEGLLPDSPSLASSLSFGINMLDISVLRTSSIEYVQCSLLYIYQKLADCGLQSLMIDSDVTMSDQELKQHLLKEMTFAEIPDTVSHASSLCGRSFGHYVINLFDCIDDPAYCDTILNYPVKFS